MTEPRLSSPRAPSAAEIVLVESPFSTDLTNLEAYLKAKYGL